MRKLSLVMACVLTLVLIVTAVACGGASPTATKAPAATNTPAPAATSAPASATPTRAPTSTTAPTATTAAPPGVLKVGIVAAMTGPGASWGTAIFNTHKLVAERINAAGGVTVQGKKYMFEIVAGDDKYTAAEAVTVTRKLIFEDKVNFFSGTLASASLVAMGPITDENKIIHFSNSWADKNALEGRKYVYRMALTIPSLHRDPGNWKVYKDKYPTFKTVAGITTNDQSGWAGLQSVFDSADAAGFTIAGAKLYERGTTDFKPLLTPLLVNNPDFLSLGSSPEGDIAVMIKQARELGYKGKFVGPNVDASTLGKVASKENMEGMLSYAPALKGAATPPGVIQAMEAYNQKYGTTTSVAAIMWDSLYFLKKAVEDANSLDADKIAAAIDSWGEFDTVFGKARMGGKDYYGRKAQILAPQLISEIQNGENVNIMLANPVEVPLPAKKWW